MTYIPNTRTDENYNQKYLNEIDQEYVRGFDHAVDDCLDSFFYNLDSFDFEVEGEDIELGRFLDNHEEIKDKFVENMKEWFESCRDEMIVSLIEHMSEEEYDEIKARVDKEESE